MKKMILLVFSMVGAIEAKTCYRRPHPGSKMMVRPRVIADDKQCPDGWSESWTKCSYVVPKYSKLYRRPVYQPQGVPCPDGYSAIDTRG